jgi:hypothetical protein
MSSRTPKNKAKVWWEMLAPEERQSLLAQHKLNFYKEAASRSFNELNPQELRELHWESLTTMAADPEHASSRKWVSAYSLAAEARRKACLPSR